MKKFLFHFAVLALSCVIIGFTVSSTFAQSYPNKPIRMIVAFAPGGPNDIRARIIGQKLTESLGQQVVVENKAGADGAIGAEMAAKAAPDGYTLFYCEIASVTITPNLYKKVRYDPIKDFEPITQTGSSAFTLLVNPSVPVKSVKELVALAKSKPGQLNYGSGASLFYLAMERFKLMTGINMVHIPYKGSGPAVAALVSGEVSVAFDTTFAPIPHVKAGRLRAIAICVNKRSPAIPDVPTMAESGFPFEATAWSGVLAPAGTSKEIVKTLNTEIVNILHMQDVKERFANVGDEIVAGTPEQFAAHIKAELEKYAKVIKDVGIPKVD
jgi:tripartite-type tricarboxylate transporter receptor subunit TctC